MKCIRRCKALITSAACICHALKILRELCWFDFLHVQWHIDSATNVIGQVTCRSCLFTFNQRFPSCASPLNDYNKLNDSLNGYQDILTNYEAVAAGYAEITQAYENRQETVMLEDSDTD
ncbi:hypothetical protein CAEBREN_15835 [Caenorhabditis brenneri]|uniref:Uncharacterized protein n=1 Tax=Caenorhabditis brenneri TaxID=135651 RepID=G0MY57_CAEBE|nr:hypothetical protein CAEBREN_15835 [Caenorhabditis brenneri]